MWLTQLLKSEQRWHVQNSSGPHLDGNKLRRVSNACAQLQEILISVTLPSFCICEVVLKRYRKLNQCAAMVIPNDDVGSLVSDSNVLWEGVG